MDAQFVQMIINIIQIVVPLLVAFGTFYHSKGKEWFMAKIGLIKDNETRTAVANAFNRVDELIVDGLTCAETTLKDDIIKGISTGYLSKQALVDMGTDVKNNVYEQLSDKVKDTLSLEIQDIEDYIHNRVERKLVELKADPNSPISKTVIPSVETSTVPSVSSGTV